MKKSLELVLNYIDDDLISEAADYAPKKKAKPIKLFKYSAAAACCAAAIAGVIALKAVIKAPGKDAFLENPSTASDNILSNIDSIISQSGAPSSTSTSKGIPSSAPPADGLDLFPEILNYEALLKLTNDPNIVWGIETKTIGSPGSDWTKPGTTKVSDGLAAEIKKDPNAVRAVLVSFEPCKNDTEIDKWEYSGTTIGEIKYQIKMLSPGSEKNPESSANKTTESIDESQMLQYLQEQLTDAIYDYYFTKVRSFLGTFNTNGLLIYPITVGIEDTDVYNYFFCFAAGSQLESFTCKENEAFIFYALSKETFSKYA